MAKSTRKTAAKATVVAQDDIQFNMLEAAVLPVEPVAADPDILASLLDDIADDASPIEALDGEGEIMESGADMALGGEEIVEEAAVEEPATEAPVAAAADPLADLDAELASLIEEPAAAAPAAADEDMLEDAVAGAERTEAKQALYAEQEAPKVEDEQAPTTDPEALLAPADDAKKKKKPATPRATSVNTKPGDLLKMKLGEKANDFLVFQLSDAAGSEEDLQAARDAFIERMNDREAIADKVKDKIQMLLMWLTKGGELNEVLKRTFTVLAKDGQITSGDKGNLHANLLAKPYSQGTARSQGNQMFMALPELKIVIKEKGRMIPNPDSALLPLINAQLGL